MCQFIAYDIGSFFCCGGKVLLRPEKKNLCTKGIVPYSCGVVLVFLAFFLLWRESGSGTKLAVFLLWRESFITTGKKKLMY